MNSLDAAVTYAEQGWVAIPIRYNSKVSSIAWKSYTDTRPTALEYQTWFAGQQTNIAILTGPISGLVVVDIDNPELYEEFIGQWPTDRISRTPRGGYHLYYKYSGNDIGNSVSKIDSGVDIRGRHGYVLAPPSIVKYGTNIGGYAWLVEGTPAPLPDDLRQTIVESLNTQVQTSNLKEDGSDLLNRVLSDGFTPGKHNEEIKDTARYLYRMGMNEDAVVRMLQVVNSRDTTPLPYSELKATIHSGISYESGRVKNDATQAASDGTTEFDAVDIVDYTDLFGDAEGKWLIEDWLPENSIMMVGAPPEMYKTWLGLDAAISLALGSDCPPFLGEARIVQPAMPVYIIQQEDNPAFLVSRVRTILEAKAANMRFDYKYYPGDDPGFEIHSPWFADIYFHTQSRLAFDDDETIDRMLEQIVKKDIHFVYIDPLYMLGDANDYFASIARHMGKIKDIRTRHNVTFMFAHHTRKSGGDGRETLYGSRLLDGSMEGIWLLSVKNEQRIITRYGKAFPGEQPRHSILFDIDTAKPVPIIDADGSIIYRTVSQYEAILGPVVNDKEELAGAVGDHSLIVLNALKGGIKTIATLSEETGIHKEQIRRACLALVSAGQINEVKGKPKKYYIPTAKPLDI